MPTHYIQTNLNHFSSAPARPLATKPTAARLCSGFIQICLSARQQPGAAVNWLARSSRTDAEPRLSDERAPETTWRRADDTGRPATPALLGRRAQRRPPLKQVERGPRPGCRCPTPGKPEASPPAPPRARPGVANQTEPANGRGAPRAPVVVVSRPRNCALFAGKRRTRRPAPSGSGSLLARLPALGLVLGRRRRSLPYHLLAVALTLALASFRLGASSHVFPESNDLGEPPKQPLRSDEQLMHLAFQAGFPTNNSSPTRLEATLASHNTESPEAEELQRLRSKVKHLEALLFERTANSTNPSATNTTTTEATKDSDDDDQGNSDSQDDTGAGGDAHDAENRASLPDNPPAEAKNHTDAERLVALQSRLQSELRSGFLKSLRSAGGEALESLALSGACSGAILNFVASLTSTQAFAFKFLDATAKIPSGVLHGLLSDFGDFDECLAIRSRADVEPEHEEAEHAYSGKYCLVSIRPTLNIQLAPNESAPEDLLESGILWDPLVRNYWTSKTKQGFQIGICVPSRCNSDDLEQLLNVTSSRLLFEGRLLSCQSSLELKAQHRPDWLQASLMVVAQLLLLLTIIATLIDLKCSKSACHSSCGEPGDWSARARSSPLTSPSPSSSRVVSACNPESCHTFCSSSTKTPKSDGRAQECLPRCGRPRRAALRVIICFSIRRNWSAFIRQSRSHEAGGQQRQQVIKREAPLDTCFHQPHTPTMYVFPVSQNVHQRGCQADEPAAAGEPSTPDVSSSSSGLGGSNRSDCLSIPNLDRPLSSELAGSPSQRSASIGGQPSGASLTCRTDADSSGPIMGLRLIGVVAITTGQSFLYPSSMNYQHYRSIINMNLARDSLWFALTNYTLAIDSLLYIAGLVFCRQTWRVLARLEARRNNSSKSSQASESSAIGYFMVRKLLKFLPSYMALIGVAILMPLLGDGPRWPETVSKRLGETCRDYWWSNLLFANNFINDSNNICLPSSWFVSVTAQLYVTGAFAMLVLAKGTRALGIMVMVGLVCFSALGSFLYAHEFQVRAPVIVLNESFVMEIDQSIYKLYISYVNNLGPFILGIIGGLLISGSQSNRAEPSKGSRNKYLSRLLRCTFHLVFGLTALAVAASTMATAFPGAPYSRLSAAGYWALHRIGWAFSTGYLVHHCSTSRFHILARTLRLSRLRPLDRLSIPVLLIFPMLTHVHIGLVRDGLHVTMYNMLSTYITRLVLTFFLALLVHLLVTQPSLALLNLDRAAPRRRSREVRKTRELSMRQIRDELEKEGDAMRQSLLARASLRNINIFAPQDLPEEPPKDSQTA